jgi:cobalt-zinc-cadmium efflux system membrane fusion protein
MRWLEATGRLTVLALSTVLMAAAGAVGCGRCAPPDPEANRGEAAHHGDGEAPHAGESHAEDEALVTLSERAVQRSGIQVEQVTLGSVVGTVDAPAEVQLNPDRTAHVSPLVAGQLREVRATLGDTVEAGQTLAVLRSVELGQARAEYARTRAMEDVAETNYERQARLSAEGIASERSLLEAELRLNEAEAEREAARARLQVYGIEGGSGPDMTLEAPIDGVVIARHATPGENVQPADNLFTVADLSTVWVVGRIYEQHITSVEVGMPARLSLRAYPGRSWSGVVSYVATGLDERTRTLAARVEVENADGTLRPGLFGTLALRAARSTEGAVPTVPESAVQELRGRPVVFTPAEGPHTYRAVPVVLGARSAERVEVLEGLTDDARVVVRGAFILKSELLRGELGEGHAH